MNSVTALPARQQALRLPEDSFVAAAEAKILNLYAGIRQSKCRSHEVARAEARVWAQARALYLGQQAMPETPDGDDWRPDDFLAKAWRAVSRLDARQVSQLRHPTRSRDRVGQQDVLDGRS